MQSTPITSREQKMKVSWWGLFTVLIVVGIATALAEWARLGLVEPEAIAQRCLAGEQLWQCPIRNALVMGFVNNVFGIAALIVGLLAIVSRWRSAAVIAIVFGVTGAVLYRYELSGIGILLGALTLVSAPRDSAN